MYITSLTQYWIAEIEGEEIKESGIYKCRINNRNFKRNTHYSMGKMRESSLQEIAHLKACIKAGKLLPFTEEMLETNYENGEQQDYEIY